LEHDAPLIPSNFTSFRKIADGHLKFLPRRVHQGFQRTCHGALRSGVIEKTIFGRAFFPSGSTSKSVFGEITHNHLKFLPRKVCQGFQRSCVDALRSGDTEKTIFGA
jgi:hypothetical protein